jgi:hypothetical protein
MAHCRDWRETKGPPEGGPEFVCILGNSTVAQPASGVTSAPHQSGSGTRRHVKPRGKPGNRSPCSASIVHPVWVPNTFSSSYRPVCLRGRQIGLSLGAIFCGGQQIRDLVLPAGYRRRHAKRCKVAPTPRKYLIKLHSFGVICPDRSKIAMRDTTISWSTPT